MTATALKSSAEIVQDSNDDQLLGQGVCLDPGRSRRRRIARIGSIWERRKLLGKFVAYGASSALLIAFLIPSRYASTTRLMPPDSPQGQGLAMLATLAGKMGGSLGAVGSDLFGLKTSADLFATVLLSRTVQDDLINKFDLRRVYGERRWVDARKELTRQTDITIDRKSGVLMIEVTDHDPKRATAMAQEYVAELNSVVTQLNTSSAHRERVFLEERLDQVKKELESAEQDFSQFSSKNGTIDIKEQGKAMVEGAAAVEGQLIATQTEVQGLRQIYTDNNVRVRAMQARVDELKRQIHKLGGTVESGGTPDSTDNELYPSIRKLPLLGVAYADLYRRSKVEETIFEILTQEYELAKVEEAKEVPSVKVLDPADSPEKKVFPPRMLIVVAGAMLAFALGVSWIFARDEWRGTDPQDPGKVLVLNMVRSVMPPLELVEQQRASLVARARKFVERFQGGVSPAETKE